MYFCSLKVNRKWRKTRICQLNVKIYFWWKSREENKWKAIIFLLLSQQPELQSLHNSSWIPQWFMFSCFLVLWWVERILLSNCSVWQNCQVALPFSSCSFLQPRAAVKEKSKGKKLIKTFWEQKYRVQLILAAGSGQQVLEHQAVVVSQQRREAGFINELRCEDLIVLHQRFCSSTQTVSTFTFRPVWCKGLVSFEPK